MQDSIHSELNKKNDSSTSNNKRRNRKRRPRNRRKQKQADELKQQHVTESAFQQKEHQSSENLSLSDLTSEAHALEMQLAELSKNNYRSSKEQGRDIALAQISAIEEEIRYVRQSLKRTYRRLFAVDLQYAATHHIEDKIWRYVFYADIEEIRSKLRKQPRVAVAIQPDDSEKLKSYQKILFHRIENAFKFYRELNHKVKSDHHIEDTRIFGVDLFKNNDDSVEGNEVIGKLLQFNYNCMGDLARYHAQQAMTIKNNAKKTSEYWSLAKYCYLKAIDVYRSNGKPYSQLALVSISNGSAIDVVWYYCMSLSVKHPSTVARDNLKSFYSKIKFNTNNGKQATTTTDNPTVTQLISQFVESFLHMHKIVMFDSVQKESEEGLSSMLSTATQLGTAMFTLIQDAQQDEKDEIQKSIRALFQITRTTLSRTVTILMISIWITSERLKDKANYNARPLILSCQILMYTFVFKLLTSVYRSSRESLEQVKESMHVDKYSQLEILAEQTMLPALSIWLSYLYTNLAALSQYCATAASDTRNREPEKKMLLKSIQSLISLLISHPSFPDPVLNVLPPTYPMTEDLLLLGLVPLTSFHQKVDYFKEEAYKVHDKHAWETRKQVQWGRIRNLIKMIADSSSFDFIHYNQTEQKYSIIDENAKRQQQSRFMKALATQRLIEQVSSLEKNVNRIQLGTNKQQSNDEQQQQQQGTNNKKVYTCVVDVTAFLDNLNKVKKWSGQTLNVDRRTQSSILQVIVPLEVIDQLDDYKKGTSHMNLQARESIRYLDQKLLEGYSNNNKGEAVAHSTSFLRTQKVNEKLTEWEEAKKYFIGEESRSTMVNDVLSEEEEEEREAEEEDSGSDDDLFKRRRGGGNSSSDASEYESSDVDESEDDEQDNQVEEYDYQDHNDNDEEEEEEPYTYNDVPKRYRPIISCLLYYHAKEQEREQENQPDHLVLVTHDQDLAWWAELFGNVQAGKRLLIKTVDEWDAMVNKLDFEKVYDYSWKHR